MRTALPAYPALALGMLFLFILQQRSFAQAGLLCAGQVTIHLSDGCSQEVYPQNILSGTQIGDPTLYTVDVANTGTNVVDVSYAGQTIMISVTENTTGNSCWGLATIVETGLPIFSNCADVTISCLDDARPVSEGGDVPDASADDCSPLFPLFYQDVVLNGTCTDDFTQQLLRTWTAEDSYGNVATCTQTITLERLFLNDLAITCPADVTLSCSPDGVDTSPATRGFPMASYNGRTYDLRTQPCDLMVFNTDQIIDKCGAGALTVRTWTVMDMCPNGNPVPFTCVQEIKVIDDVDPVVTAPADITLAVNTNTCTAQYVLDTARVVDCSAVSFNTITPLGIQAGNGGALIATGLPLGTNIIAYVATDECGNTGTATAKVTVADQTPPQVNCELIKQIGLGNDGTATVPAFVFDNASTDNCCDTLTFRARRQSDNCGVANNTTFAETVSFCCSDLGETVMVELEVSDCFGNTSLCTVQVNLVDKIDPEVTCPPDITISCALDPYDLSVVGDLVTDPALQTAIDGLATDACSTPTVSYQDNVVLGTCGGGTITRSWAVEAPGASLVCIQRITIENTDPFTCADVSFPADALLDYCNADLDPATTGEPLIGTDFTCADLSIEYSDVDATGSTAACRKLLRTWIVTDLCQYDPTDADPLGRCEHQQVIEVFDNELPVFSNCLPRNVCNENPDCGPALSDLSVGLTDACNAASDLQLIWFVDLNDDNVSDVGAEFSGAGVNTANAYPNGTHRIRYQATDPCGNVAECSFLFTVEDCLEPDAVCPTGIALTLDADGQGQVNTNQFNMTASSDNCSQVLSYSFSSDVNDNVRSFTCADRGLNNVTIWATDPDGNQSFCTTTVDVQDNAAQVCGPLPLVGVAGYLRTETGAGVPASVTLSGGASTATDADADGYYSFAQLPTGQDYHVQPTRDDQPLDGVTTFDIVLISQHILGTQSLDSPYKLIAADANGSGSISALDLVTLRKLILYLDDALPGGHSWRFVDGQHVFADPTQPWDAPGFPELCTLEALATPAMQTDFIAVKIGDVNGSVSVNGVDITNRNGSVSLLTEDRHFAAGERFTVDFRSADALVAYQLALVFDEEVLELMDYSGPNHTATNFAAAASELRVSFDHTESQQDLLQLTFLAKRAGRLSEQLRFDERRLRGEAVVGQVAKAIELTFTPTATSDLSISPNPFTEVLHLDYRSVGTAPITCILYDARGQEVYRQELPVDGPRTAWDVDTGALPLVPGLHLLRIQQAQHQLTHRVFFQK